MKQPRRPATGVAAPDFPTVRVAGRSAWRAWLASHQDSSPGAWLVWRQERGGVQALSLDDAVEEALCYGWIDSRLRHLDTGETVLRFTPRRPTGTWSPRNKARVRSLIKRGLMTASGLRVVEAAKRDGSWKTLDEVEYLRVPKDLAQALAAHPAAARNFAGLAPSTRKVALWWVVSTRVPATRNRRIADTVRWAGGTGFATGWTPWRSWVGPVAASGPAPRLRPSPRRSAAPPAGRARRVAR